MGKEKNKRPGWHSKSDNWFNGVVFTLTIEESLAITEFDAQFSIEPTPDQKLAFIDVENDLNK